MKEVLPTLQSLKHNSLDLVVAESFAALRVVIFAKEMGWQKMALKANALQVVMFLKKDGKNWSVLVK